MIYSPSQTALWLECRQKRALHRQGLRRVMAGKRELAAILGTAVAAGLADYNRCRLGARAKPSSCVETARDTAALELATLDADGRQVGEWDTAQRDALVERAGRIVERYCAADPVPPEWPVLSVETPCDESGARPDLVIDDGRGPAPLDYKVKLALKREYEMRELARWRDSWQMLHYASRVCTPGPYRYYICCIVAEPFRVALYPFEISEATMRWWRDSAKQYWFEMTCEDPLLKLDHNVPEMAAKHADEYGDCEYREWCFGSKEGYLTVKKGAR